MATAMGAAMTAEDMEEGTAVFAAAVESLGETFTAAVLPRGGVFNPVGQIPLTYAKPSSWGALSPWNILAAGSGVEDGQPFFAFSIAFDDPTAADANFDEIKARVENYQSLVPQRFSENPALIEGWPSQPFDEACSDISINALSWTFGSTITVACQTETNLFWSQLVNMRDLGFWFLDYGTSKLPPRYPSQTSRAENQDYP